MTHKHPGYVSGFRRSIYVSRIKLDGIVHLISHRDKWEGHIAVNLNFPGASFFQQLRT